MTTPAASRKDKHGNRTYAIPHPETRELLDLPSWSRLKNLMYNGGIETWKLKKVARAVAMSTALQMDAANPDTCYKAVEKVLDGDSEAADIGTHVHRYTEEVDAGTLEWDFVPPAAAPYIKAYEALKAEWSWETVEAEVTIFNLLIGYAGSADRFVRIPGLPAHLGLPGADLDVFSLDIKTGKIHPEVALQLAAYTNGEGIFEAPSKMDLGFTVREAQLEEDIRNGVGFDRINPKRKKWSDDAIRETKGVLESEWWETYAQHGRFRPMPDGLRKDVGLVLHLRSVDVPEGAPPVAKADLIPVRIDGNPLGYVVPAMHVIDGLRALYQWQRRKDVIGDPVDRSKPAEKANLDPFKPATSEDGVAVVADTSHDPQDQPAEAPAGEGVGLPNPIAPLEAAGLLEGAQIADSDEHLEATDEDKTFYIAWLADMAANRKHVLPALRQGLDEAGLVKKLRSDVWTVGELRRWSQVAIAVERAAL